MTTDSFDDSVGLATRMGAELMALTVRSVTPLTPGTTRVELGGDALRTLTPIAGQDLMLTVPGEPPLMRRRWTIRRHDAVAGTVLLDVALHADGGASDLHLRSPGDVVEAIGPRGKVHVDAAAGIHHFLGDLSYLPAASAMAEAVQLPAQTVVTLAVTGQDRLRLDAPACPGGITWVDPGDPADPLTTAKALVDAAGIGAGAPDVVAYVGGEMALVQMIRAHLVNELGWDRDAVKPKPYWRAGVANGRNGEPAKET